MLDATPNISEGPSATIDPSMTKLAPPPSPFRNSLLLAAGALVLIGAMFSPAVLRPVVAEPHAGDIGQWGALANHRQAETLTTLTSQTWPHVEVRSVEDVPGARVAGAWMVDESVLALLDSSLDETTYDSRTSYLEAAMPGFDSDRDALPQTLDRGETAVLIVLWDIDSCEALTVDPTAPARLRSRTIFRTSNTETLPDIAAPGFDIPTLRQAGACP